MLTLSILPDTFAVVRLEPKADFPAWGVQGAFFSVTKTDEELSIVCADNQVPSHLNHKVERGWRCLKVEGPLDFALTGILASLAKPLADAKVSIFAVSTFDTDYLLIKKENFEKAIGVLKAFCKIKGSI